MTKQDKEYLEFFCTRVERFNKAKDWRQIAEPIHDSEITEALYILAKEHLKKKPKKIKLDPIVFGPSDNVSLFRSQRD